jgi:hypothetical protein
LKTFGTDSNDQVKYIEISRSNPLVMYVNQQPASGSVGTLWKTTDGGTTWNSIPIPSGNSRVMLIALDYTDADILWIAYTYGANGSKIFKTTDGGTSWTNITTATLNNEDPHSLAAIANTDGGIYLCSGRTVFYRNNTLPDWQIVNDSLPAYFDSDIVHPFYRDGKIRIASYGKGIWQSSLYDQPTAPAAQITVDKLEQTVVCVADSFYFDDYSALNHAGATWQWTFQNGTPATSSLRNPHVFFSAPGTYLATLTVTDGNGHSGNDSLYVTVNSFVPPTAVQEGFQSSFPPGEIMIVNPENDAQWSLNSSCGGFGNSSQCAIFDNYDNDSHGKWDDMRVSVNFTNPASDYLTFDVAHACYGGQYTDTLEVLVSTDCGTTFTQLYKKWGSTLATVPNSSNYYTPAASEWRTDSINLSAYAGTAHLLVAFRNIGLWGNNIYIDNINMQSLITNVNHMKQDKLDVYPNPVSRDGSLTVTDPSNEKIKVTLFDAKGSMVFKEQITSTSQIGLAKYNLSPGIYHLNLFGETRIMNYKIMVK